MVFILWFDITYNYIAAKFGLDIVLSEVLSPWTEKSEVGKNFLASYPRKMTGAAFAVLCLVSTLSSG